MPTLGAVVLTGGRSTRMGRDKATLSYGNKRLVDHMVSILEDVLSCVHKPASKQVYISGYIQEYPSIPDQIPGLGPIGGIASSFLKLKQIYPKNSGIFFVPVDMPFLSQDVLLQLVGVWLKNHETIDAIHFKDYPLPFILKLSEQVERVLMESQLKKQGSVKSFLGQLFHRTLELRPFPENSFRNINTPEEYKNIQCYDYL